MANKDKVEEMRKIQQSILEREVDEDLHREKMQNLWQRYSGFVYGGIALILVAVAGQQWYLSHKKSLRMQETDSFETAVIQQVENKREEAVATLNRLEKDSRTQYKYLALLKKANILLTGDKQAEGYAVLKQVMDDSSAPDSFRAIARLSFVGNQLGVLNAQQALAILSPLLQEKNAFYGSAAELKALVFLQEGKKEEARKFLKETIAKNLATPYMQKRLEILSVSIERE